MCCEISCPANQNHICCADLREDCFIMMTWNIEMVSKNESDVAIPNMLCVNRAAGSCTIHTHEFLEVVYIHCGSNTQIINGISYEAKKGDVFFINIGDTHEYIGSNSCVLINFIFMPGAVPERISGSKDNLLLPPFVRLSGEQQKNIENVVLTIEMENNRKNFGYEVIVKNYFAILIMLLIRYSCDTEYVADDGDEFKQIADYIDQNFATTSLYDIAKNFSYNSSYFSRRFKDAFGMTYSNYILMKRMKKAKDMLSNTNESIEDISNKCGFRTVSGFYKKFRSYANMTPNMYRKLFPGSKVKNKQ